MLKFSNAQIDDIPSLNVLVSRAYRGDISRRGWTTEAHLLGGQRTDPEMLREMILGSNAVIRLAHHKVTQELVGCVYLMVDHRGCYLGLLAVDPTQQNSGWGKSLLSDAEAWGRSQGAQKMWMSVIVSRTELISWYERRGYVRTGVFKEFPRDERYGLPQVPAEELKLEILEKQIEPYSD